MAAAVIEVVGGALLTLGLFTRATAFICSGEMAAAYFLFHFPKGFWPGLNGGDRRSSTAHLPLPGLRRRRRLDCRRLIAAAVGQSASWAGAPQTPLIQGQKAPRVVTSRTCSSPGGERA